MQRLIAQDNRLNSFIMAVSAALIIFSLCGYTRINIVVFIALSLWFCFVEEGVIFADLFFLLPFATVFKYESGATSLVTYLQIIALIIILLRKKKIGRTYLFGILILTLYVFIQCLFIGEINIVDPLKVLFGFLMIYVVLKYSDNYDFERITKAYLYGIVISSVVALFAPVIPNFYLFVRKIGYNMEITNRFSGMNGDPNYYAMGLIILLFAVFCLKKKNNSLFFITYILVSLFGLMTYSKSFLLIFVVITIFIVVDLIKRKKFRLLFTFAMLLSLLLVYMLIFKERQLELFLNRFLISDDLDGLTSGRVTIWNDYLKEIFSSFISALFGHSMSAGFVGKSGPHSFYIELLYYIGFVGTFVFVALLRHMRITFCKQTRKLTLESKSALLLFLLPVAFLQMLFSNELYFQLLFVFMTVQYCEKGRLYETND